MSLPHKPSRQGCRRSICTRHRTTALVASAAGGIRLRKLRQRSCPNWRESYHMPRIIAIRNHCAATRSSFGGYRRPGRQGPDRPSVRGCASIRVASCDARFGDDESVQHGLIAHRIDTSIEATQRTDSRVKVARGEAARSRDRGRTYDNSAERKGAAAPADMCEWRQE
jgi:hypothetical protein